MIAFGTDDREPTELRSGAPATTVPGAAPTTTTPVPVTMVDGTPAPDNVYEVVAAPGEYAYLFTLPDYVDEEPTDSLVPRSTVEVSEDKTHLTVTMYCAVSDGSVPAVLRVIEDPFEVNVTPVVVGQSFGAPCPADQILDTITIALEEPVGSRRVVLSREGRKVSLAGIG